MDNEFKNDPSNLKDEINFMWRRAYLFVGALLVVIMLFLVDPDAGWIQQLAFGGTTVAWLITVLRGLFIITLSHISLSAITSWDPLSDLMVLIRTASKTPTGAGLAVIGVGIIFFGILSVYTVK